MNRRAFTIMEIILVMALIVLVFAGVFVGMAGAIDERALKRPYSELRGLAKTAWQRAMLDQRAYQIRFLPDRFILEPKQAVNEADQQLFHDADVMKGKGPGIEIVELEEGITMEVRRWGGKTWFPPQAEPVTVWVFEQSGLCEPIGVLFTMAGRSIGAYFDPLTASVRTEIYGHE
jgi:type II secretory pathway pseudopilin PulG